MSQEQVRSFYIALRNSPDLKDRYERNCRGWFGGWDLGKIITFASALGYRFNRFELYGERARTVYTRPTRLGRQTIFFGDADVDPDNPVGYY